MFVKDVRWFRKRRVLKSIAPKAASDRRWASRAVPKYDCWLYGSLAAVLVLRGISRSLSLRWATQIESSKPHGGWLMHRNRWYWRSRHRNDARPRTDRIAHNLMSRIAAAWKDHNNQKIVDTQPLAYKIWNASGIRYIRSRDNSRWSIRWRRWERTTHSRRSRLRWADWSTLFSATLLCRTTDYVLSSTVGSSLRSGEIANKFLAASISAASPMLLRCIERQQHNLQVVTPVVSALICASCVAAVYCFYLLLAASLSSGANLSRSVSSSTLMEFN